MNIWLHRISHHAEVSHPLLDRGQLSIGFSDFSEPDFLTALHGENAWLRFEKYFDEYWGSRPRTHNSLWRFAAEMKKGDWVLVPGWGTFSVYELAEDDAIPITVADLPDLRDWHSHEVKKQADGLLQSSEGSTVDLGFIRNVKPIRLNIPRSGFADAALTSRMKIRSTNANISDLKESLEKAIQAFDQNRPLNIHAQIISDTRQQVLATIRKELTLERFEALVQWYFRRIGATESYIPAKNESGKNGDADVVAVFEPIKTIIYTQVKFHTGETNGWAIEQIQDYKDLQDSMDDGYSKISWVISSADQFSEGAIQLAKENKVQLISGLQFASMMLEAGITDLEVTK